MLTIDSLVDLPVRNRKDKRVGTVKSLVHRGLKRLRRMMESEDATFDGDARL